MLRYTDMLTEDAPLLLGVKLRPLSLGHVIHLQERECVFISPVKTHLLAGDEQSQLNNLKFVTDELIVALTICSMTYDDFNALTKNQLWLEDKQKFISMKQYMAQWNKAVKKLLAKGDVNILQTIYLFNQYLTNGYVMPDTEYVGQTSTNDSPNSCDWITTLVETLTSEKSMSVKEVLDQPLKLTFLQFFKIGEKHGSIHFVSEEEKQLRDAVLSGKT